MNNLKPQSVSSVAVKGGTETSQISSKRSSFVFRRRTSLAGLERHEGE